MGEEGKIQGIILKSFDYKESSRMVDLYSQEQGRLTFAARGAKRNKSRILNLSEPYVEGAFNLIYGRSPIPSLKDGQILDAHLGLRASLTRMVCAAFTVDLMEDCLNADPDPDLYRLLQAQLKALETLPDEAAPRLMAAFMFKLTAVIGFRPSLGRCLACGREMGPQLAAEGILFNLEEGGILCARHGLAGRKLSIWEYQELVAYICQPLNVIIKELNPQRIPDYRQMEGICLQYYRIHTGRSRLPSLGMMEDMKLI